MKQHAEFVIANKVKTTHFCPMKITEDVRKYAGDQDMELKSKEFSEKGAVVCAKA